MHPERDKLIDEAVFRLGQLAHHPGLTNKRLLRRLSRTIARYCVIDVVGVAVHERGMAHPADMTHVVGPWSDEEAGGFVDWSRWLAEDADVSERINAAKRNRVHRLSDVVGEDDYKATKLFSQFFEPMNVVDQAFGIYRRADGAELLIAVMALEHTGPLTERNLRRFTKIAPYASKAWAHAWRFEPAWVLKLKPISQRVLEGVMDGLDDEQIGQQLGITYHAVRAHMKRLFREAGVRSRLHLMQAYKNQRTGLAGSVPSACGLHEEGEVVTVVDPADTAFGITVNAAS